MGEEVLPTDELLGPEPPQRPEPGERDDARPAVDDSREAIVRNTAVMSVGTGLSRLTGFARLAAMAFARGEAVAAERIEPAYLRNNVALTLKEQQALRESKR